MWSIEVLFTLPPMIDSQTNGYGSILILTPLTLIMTLSFIQTLPNLSIAEHH